MRNAYVSGYNCEFYYYVHVCRMALFQGGGGGMNKEMLLLRSWFKLDVVLCIYYDNLIVVTLKVILRLGNLQCK